MSFYVYETRYEGVNDVEVTDAERIEELTRNLKITNESWRRMHRANGVLREALKFYADKENWIAFDKNESGLVTRVSVDVGVRAITALDSPT